MTKETTHTSGADRTADAPAVRCRGAAKSFFGAVRAVAGIDLDIRRGETVALLGRNGAGKSTTISLLTGLEEPDAGSVRLAVALAGNPELLVLDEPTAALDVEARRTLWASVRDYAGRGNTVLFSTHYLEEADEHADRILVVDQESSWRTASMVAMAAYGALGAALSAGTGVAEDRSSGWLRRLRVTPMSPGQVVTGRALTGSVIVLPAIAAVLVAGAFAQTTGLVNVGCSLGLSIAGGLWFPVELLPDWLCSLAGFIPTHRFAEIGQSLAEGAAPSPAALAVLAVWALLFGTYAVLSYRRSGRTV